MEAKKMKVIKQNEIADRVYELVLRGEDVLEAKPGQFLMIKPDREDLLLRRPISIAAYDKERSECTLIYRVEGCGTRQMSTLQAGDLVDSLGPLGNGFKVEEKLAGKQVLVVGGGIGVPPLYQLGKELQKIGAKVTFVNGFSSKKDIFYEAEMAEIGEVHISTVDGTFGTRGFVTDITNQFDWTPDAVFSCGPRAMLRAVQTNFQGAEVYLSLEERMACGIGACYACVARANEEGKQFKVCQDGPVFHAKEVKL
ncbi:dihydroorotate dehydrogenase, electron transfer subunit [Listeria fleischmannii 1991]|uniref:Dihydroorotate dehydrogenase B (NAD(+)), electron transfer subunit n=3 Tax=Listeria fleischmannii TaxID=1069827 RepID=A0A2X3H305_9LIST|nr:dihydroorotate dehydrogenase electron transfer subunit [Listeria fleischmannii]EMG27029.1 dihydroorotate dehydrogenase, electron transfer subunit [Listeria fleischmannii subsp. fleischmannii LU2006-1]EUJ58834.1 dihydroorotate dehydrogenase, electron transfer subunit [Listeria fleischmannii FSL S10-1203]KMT61112.1 dihydroorotate dehydrogenase, electron transfer subunit [Listeria fleischmannii 1991]SQC65075.1 Dihydrdoorotate oxidase B, electron transfer subunit [Listeria fleischmannii subsp. f